MRDERVQSWRRLSVRVSAVNGVYFFVITSL